jgi:three-Cys-motif partner protein
MVSCKDVQTTGDLANPHTIKKFELIEEYVKAWAPKLLNYPKCTSIFFIDCMCNSGIYYNSAGKKVFGTPIRIAQLFFDLIKHYPTKQVRLYFNDLSADKIAVLKTYLPPDADNYHIITSCCDGNDFIKIIAKDLPRDANYLLIYDPYTATIDWTALEPFLLGWGEVIINHMVSDPIRGVSQAKNTTAIEKYENTYLTNIAELISLGSDKRAYEERIQEIIRSLRGSSNKQYFIASFPFFISSNVLIYSLIHCSSNIAGFRLFKKVAWKTFEGKSSLKDTHGTENQLVFCFDGSSAVKTLPDEDCYYVEDIADYIHDKFRGMKDVPLKDIWRSLDEHPVYPSEGYRLEIKKWLKDIYKDNVAQNTITFTDRKS